MPNINVGKDYNFFVRKTVSNAAFTNDSDVVFSFIGPLSFSLINEGAGIIEYSFNGHTLHGDLVPGTPSSSIVFNDRGYNQVWFRLKSGASSDIRVEACHGSIGLVAPTNAIIEALEGRLITDAGVWTYLDAVTPADGTDLPNAPARGILVLTDGNVTFEALNSDGVTRYTVGPIMYTAKDIIPIAVYRVHSTGTTATVAAGF